MSWPLSRMHSERYRTSYAAKSPLLPFKHDAFVMTLCDSDSAAICAFPDSQFPRPHFLRRYTLVQCASLFALRFGSRSHGPMDGTKRKALSPAHDLDTISSTHQDYIPSWRGQKEAILSPDDRTVIAQKLAHQVIISHIP